MHNPESIESLLFTKDWAVYKISALVFDALGTIIICPFGDKTSDCILKESETSEFAFKGSCTVKLNLEPAL